MTSKARFAVPSVLVVVLSAGGLVATAACSETASIEDRPCPCADGYSCCAATNRCVASGEACSGSGDLTPDGGDASKDARSGDLPPDGGDGGDTNKEADPTRLRVFLTSAVYRGDLGGLAGADARCAEVAQNAGVSSSWVAFLSDSKTHALDHVKGDGPWYLMDRKTLAFPNHLSLTLEPRQLDQDESGEKYNAYIWTGTNPHHPATSCSDWTTTSGEGTFVHAESFTVNVSDTPCTDLHSILCFEQR